MGKDISAKETIAYIKKTFDQVGLCFWLEAGTALAAIRDGKIFDWEHDIDLGVWREDLPKVLELIEVFKRDGCSVKVQKGLPFIDNIIQIFLPDNSDGSKPFPDQIDLYLFTRQEGYAYMRWLQKPEGRFAALKKKTFMAFRNFLSGESRFLGPLSTFFPIGLRFFLFKEFLHFHIKYSECIYHRFPEEYFLNLKTIDFYGTSVYVAEDSDNYLAHRYGGGWKTPDQEYNQAGKWKKAQARVMLPMSLLPAPEINLDFLKLSNG